MSEAEKAVVEVVDRDNPTVEEVALAAPMQTGSTYMEAIEFGKVAAMSSLFPNARDAAKAAMVCAMGASLGISFPIALSKIHILEKNGRITFIIEGAVLGGLINERPGISYRVVETTPTRAEIEFLRDGEPVGPNIVWDQEKAVRAGLWSKAGPWQQYPDAMLRWRALAEGTRIYFPEVIAGGAVYVKEEMDDQRSLEETLTGPAPPSQLDDAEAEEIREQVEATWNEIAAVNPERITWPRARSAMRSAGHSHVELRGVLRQMQDLRDTEIELQAEIEKLGTLLDEKAAKEIVARAERRGDQREKIEVVRKAIEGAEGETTKEADDATTD